MNAMKSYRSQVAPEGGTDKQWRLNSFGFSPVRSVRVTLGNTSGRGGLGLGDGFVLLARCGKTQKCQGALLVWFGSLLLSQWESAELGASRFSRKAVVANSEHRLGSQFGPALGCPPVVSHAGWA